MKIVIIDGQGGRMGKAVIEQLKAAIPNLNFTPLAPTALQPLPC